MRKIWALVIFWIGLMVFSSVAFVMATPYYHHIARCVVGGSDREEAKDGMYAFVSGTFYLPPRYGNGGFLTNLHWDAGPKDVVGIGFYPLYPHWWGNPNAKIYGPNAYAEVKVVDDFVVVYAEIDEHDAYRAAWGAEPHHEVGNQ
ncbi:hypothetical protein [Thermococcus prieurii]